MAKDIAPCTMTAPSDTQRARTQAGADINVVRPLLAALGPRANQKGTSSFGKKGSGSEPPPTHICSGGLARELGHQFFLARRKYLTHCHQVQPARSAGLDEDFVSFFLHVV